MPVVVVEVKDRQMPPHDPPLAFGVGQIAHAHAALL